MNLLASGFKPDEDIEVSLHSDPVTLGYTTADSAGTVRFAAHIPAGTPAGVHHVVVRGLESGAVVQAQIRILAVGSPSEGVRDLAHTGVSGMGPVLMAAGAALLLGVAGVLFARRRRAQKGEVA